MPFSMAKVTVAAILTVLGLLVVALSGKLTETVDADKYVVIQSPVEGRLDWYTSPGLAWQGFGEVTAYPQRGTFDFSQKGIPVQFNDGGHGTIFGSIQYELPGDKEALTALHRKYSNKDRVAKDLIETVINASIYLSGTLMSSKESYAEKRNDLVHYVTDQVQNGIYRTRQKIEWVKDPVTNQDKQVITAEIVRDKDNHPVRQEESPLQHYKVKAFNFTIYRLPYDPVVEAQIKQQQNIAMEIQTSAAQLKQAEQRAMTAEQQGRANATTTKWEQEAIKAREVTKAEQEKQVFETNAARDKNVAEIQAKQRLAVAELDRQAAEQTKLQQIALGEGESTRKRLVLEADGALEQKLRAYVEVMPKIFESMRGTTFVPQIVMGGPNGSNPQSTNASGLIDLLTAKTAKDIALDLSLPSGRGQSQVISPVRTTGGQR